MSVKGWFTISAVVLVALFVATAARFLRTPEVPALLVRVGTKRLDGSLIRSCWPPGQSIHCTTSKGKSEERTIPADGTLRLVAAHPVTPEDGFVEIDSIAGARQLRQDSWKRNLDYDLAPGHYRLIAEARFGRGSSVRYEFRFRAT